MNRILRWLFLKTPLYKAMDKQKQKNEYLFKGRKVFYTWNNKNGENLQKKNKLKEGTHFDSGISILSKTTEEDINYF